jgi:putative oxidoreductase
MKSSSKIMYWVARLVAALIMLQTLYFKFTAAPESVFIFTTVGMEPWGRIAVGIFELIASVLLITSLAWVGAGLALALMSGAIFMHLTFLGIVVMDDKGYLFMLAVIVSMCSLYVLYADREKIVIATKGLRQRLN